KDENHSKAAPIERVYRNLSLTLELGEMGTRIDDLEKNVAELMTQAGMEEQAASK
uniref:Heat shock factor binding protein 1 n=1 Tax=Sparus aurata TaxID=8175 RepID=A0A671TLP2_SPAAU